MASVNISPVPKLQFFDGNGAPLAGGLLYTKHGGTNNDKVTYTDSSGTVAHANPIVLDSEGRASIFLTSGAYKFILTTAEGAAVYTADGVSSSFQVASVDTIADVKDLTIGNNTFIRTLGNSAVNDGGGWTYYWDATSTDADDGGMTIQPATLPAAGRWKGIFPDNRELNLKVYGAACDGVTNDVNEIIACDAYCNANGVTMVVDGTAYFATDPTIESRVRLLPGAQLKWGNFQPTIDILIDNDDQTQHFTCAAAYVPVTKLNNVFPEWFGETVSSYPITTAAAAAAVCVSLIIITGETKANKNIRLGANYINNTGAASKGLTFSTSGRADIYNTPSTFGDIRYNLSLNDDTAMAAGVGPGIALTGKYKADGTYQQFAGIKGIKANAVEADYSGQLHFQTRLNGSTPATRMILDENGTLTVSGNLLVGANIGIAADTDLLVLTNQQLLCTGNIKTNGDLIFLSGHKIGVDTDTNLMSFTAGIVNVNAADFYANIAHLDSVILASPATIGRYDDTDLMTISPDVLTVAGAVKPLQLDIVRSDPTLTGIELAKFRTTDSSSVNPQLTIKNSSTGMNLISSAGSGIAGGLHFDSTGSVPYIGFKLNGTQVGLFYNSGKFGVNGDLININTAKTPASATASGSTGDICWSSDYIYVCVAANTWKRAALSTW
jgi:hypothetical protein